MGRKIFKEKILIIDFGSQVTKLIARRVRDLGVFSEIITAQNISKIKDYNYVKGIILSGGPATVTKKNHQKVPKEIFFKNIPILGICYGLQLIANLFGGSIKSSKKKREIGRTILRKKKKSLLIKNFFNENNKSVWMSHQDAVTKLPKGFKVIASTNKSKLTIIENTQKKIYGIQFHPEVTHTEKGKEIFKNFLFSICLIKKKWQVSSEKNKIINNIKHTVKNDKVVCALSGGVDSSVVALLINKAIGKNLVCIMVDTGLMRKNEFKYSYRIFKKRYKLNVKLINASKLYFKKLKNINDPEKKRKIIGELFIRLFEANANKIKNIEFLAQGTIYPDVIESSSKDSKSDIIKSHHNVGGLPKKMKFQLVEPIKLLFKDEVRRIGKALKIPRKLIERHPFPGPGLAVRIIGEITKEKVTILQEVDSIFIEELHKNNLYNKVSQALAVFLPIKSVGVMGDQRKYSYVVALRAVKTIDFMTATVCEVPYKILNIISTRIVNEVPGVSRVVYDITSKPPGTIEWE